MVRPRFAKLSPEQQQVIVRAALNEFSARGFHDASLNRMIAEAGISKGSLYYYFDDKEDLYTYVTQAELKRLFAGLDPFPVPDSADVDTFWSTLGAYYTRLMMALTSAPQLAALIRGWIAAPTNPSLQEAQRETEQTVMPWIAQTLAAGQRLGAVRRDLPPTLLISVIVGMGQAMETWLMSQPSDQLQPVETTHAMVDMIRGAVQPRARPLI